MISVIMLTYNREALVGRAIESILNQTNREFELIVVDNGSTDKSGQIADNYGAKDPRVRVIHRGRGNIGSGRNAGLDAARGEYIAFIDDDDYTEPGYLEHLRSLIEKYGADIAVCGSWREAGGVRQPKYVFDGVFSYSGEEAVCEMLKREKFNSANPTKLVSADIFHRIRYCESGKYDDIRVIYKLFAYADRAAVSGLPLYTFVRHPDNNSAGTTAGERIPAGQVEEYLDAFRERTVWLTARFPARGSYWLYTELSYALSMYDQTKGQAVQERLGALLAENAAALKEASPFYSKRDRMLLEKYKGVF